MINPIGTKTFSARPGIALEQRLPAVRNRQDKAIVLTRQHGAVRVEELDIMRSASRGKEILAPDDTIIVSELPNTLRTFGVTICLAIVLVDTKRLTGALVHSYFAEQFAEPLQFALDAMNSDPNDLRIGLSGVIGSFGGREEEIRARVATQIGTFGRVIYNQLGKKGDVAISFLDRMIFNPYDNTPPATF